MLRIGLSAALALGLAACSDSTDDQAGSQPEKLTAPIETRMNMLDFMANVVDHNADGIWLNQGWVIDASGTEELFPTDDEGWRATENAAATLAEVAGLLKIPDRMPIDDAAIWVGYADALAEKALATQEQAEKRDKEAFFDAGGDVYQVCRSCHEKFVIGM